MHFRTISSDQVSELAEQAECGDRVATAVLRVLATCRDVECLACNTEFTRRNKIGGFIVAFASDRPGAEFAVRPRSAVVSARSAGRLLPRPQSRGVGSEMWITVDS